MDGTKIEGLYARLCETHPIGRLDLSKFRRFLKCMDLVSHLYV